MGSLAISEGVGDRDTSMGAPGCTRCSLIMNIIKDLDNLDTSMAVHGCTFCSYSTIIIREIGLHLCLLLGVLFVSTVQLLLEKWDTSMGAPVVHKVH